MIEEFLDKIEYAKYYELANQEKNPEILINHAINIFKTLNICEKLAFIDILFSINHTTIIKRILDDPHNTKYFLEYKLLDGKELEKLKDPKSYSFETNYGIVTGDSIGKIETKKYMYKKIAEYIKVSPNIKDEIEKMSNEFAILFEDYYEYFQNDESDSLNLFDIATSLFNKDYNVNRQALEEIYEKLLTKEPLFSSFDYTNLFETNLEVLGRIKGIVNELPTYALYEIISNEDLTDEDIEELNNLIESIYIINKSDEETLYYFFNSLKMVVDYVDNKKITEMLEQKEYYIKYSKEERPNEILKEMVEDLKNNKYVPHNKHFIEELGEEEEFTRIDTLKLFMESSDINFKRQLIIPILIKDINILKEQAGVDFELSFETNSNVTGLCGYYSKEDEKLFVNRALIYSIEDPLEALIQCEDTFAHEIRHAKQEKELSSDTSFTYNNLLMAMELIIYKSSSSYYNLNYQNISFEQDARAEGFVYTMTYFKDYPEIQEKVRKTFEEQLDNMASFIKQVRMPIYEDKFYTSILEIFESSFGIGEEDYMREYDKRRFETYPILSIVFDQDPTTGKLTLKSKEYFENLKQGYLSLKDCKEKEEALRCLELIEYQLKVSEFVKDHNGEAIEYIRVGTEEEDNEFKTYEELKEKIEQDLGPSPRR